MKASRKLFRISAAIRASIAAFAVVLPLSCGAPDNESPAPPVAGPVPGTAAQVPSHGSPASHPSAGDTEKPSSASWLPPVPQFPAPAAEGAAAPAALAIAPLVNDSRRMVDLAVALRDFLPAAVGAAFEISGGGEVVPSQTTLAALRAETADLRQSLTDETLARLADSLGVKALLSWEPFQDEDLKAHLRLRIASNGIVYREEIPSAESLALYINFHNLYAANVRRAAEQALNAVDPKAWLLASDDSAATPTLPAARGLGEIGLGPRIAQTLEALRQKPGCASLWASLASDYARLAESLADPAALKKRLAARALAAAFWAENLNSRSSVACEGIALAEAANSLLRRAEANLNTAQRLGGLNPEGSALLDRITGRQPGGASLRDSPPDNTFALRMRARWLLDWQMFGEAESLCSANSDPLDPFPSIAMARALPAGSARERWIRDALDRALSHWLLAADPAKVRAWAEASPAPLVSSIAQALETAERTADSDALDQAARAIGEALAGEPFDLNAFLAGHGPWADLARAASAVAASGGAPPPGNPLAWTAADRAAFAKALAADAWLAAWRGAEFGAAELDRARAAIAFGEELFGPHPGILNEWAFFRHDIAFDSEERNAALARARAVEPDYAPAGRLAAQLREWALDVENAWGPYEQARAMDPFNIELSCWAAEHFARLGQGAQARAAVTGAAALAPRDAATFLCRLAIFDRRDPRPVDSQTIARLLASFPQTPALKLAAARLYFAAGMEKSALNLAAEAARARADWFEAAELRARVHAYMGEGGEMARVLAAFRAVCESRRGVAEAWELEGQLRMWGGDPALAAHAYAEAARGLPMKPAVLLGWGQACLAAGDRAGAEAAFLALHAIPPAADGALALGKMRIEEGRNEEAAEWAERARAMRPLAAGGYELQALAALAKGDQAGALDAMGQLAEQAPRNPYAFLARARVFLAMGWPDKAAEAARAGLALRDDGSADDLRQALLEALILTGNPGQDEFERAQLAKRAFENPAVRTLLARAELALGNRKEAQTHLAAALRIDPGNEKALAVQQEMDIEEAEQAGRTEMQ